MLTNPTIVDVDGLPTYIPEFTVEQYHRMIRDGLLPEGAPIELIHGQLVWKDRRDKTGDIMTVGPRHSSTIRRLWKQFIQMMDEQQFVVSAQMAVTLIDSEPEPDLSVAPGREEDFFNANPSLGQIALAVEVADSSLRYDRSVKMRLYASVSIPEYWIVNLNENQVEVHRDPDASAPSYRDLSVYKIEDQIDFRLKDSAFSVRVTEFVSEP